jgi:LTXXQ motif family protein
MRRGTILVLGLLVASTAITAVPQTAEARPAILNALRGILGAPLGIIGGGFRHGRRSASRHHHRAYASHGRPAAAAAAVAGTGAAAATASRATANPAESPAASNAGADNTVATAPPAPHQNTASAVPPETQGRGEPVHESAITERPQPKLGRMGPPAWPTAYEDVIGYALWPAEYGQQLRNHGIGDVVVTAFAPGPTLAAARNRQGTRQARAAEPGQAPAAAAGCGGWDLTSSDWPLAQISSTIELNDAQKNALDQLKTAMNEAGASIKSTCRDDANQAPVERLRAMQTTLWAVHDAAQAIRTPLARFYDTLSDQQKQQFAAPAMAQTDARAPSRGDISRSDMARMCGMPGSNEVPIRQIDQTVRPTKAQRASLEALQKKSFEMGQFLMASCLKPMPATPAERLDAAADRLTAVIFAASNVNMALNDFTSELNDDQKSKLNSLVR